MNKYIKQCEQCKEFKNFKDVKFFPKIKEVYADGHINEAPDRYYCKSCMASWEMASEGYSYDEWYSSFEQPIEVYEGGIRID